MICFRCGSNALPLAPLWPVERTNYTAAEIVMRQCMDCGLEQNHYGHDEVLLPVDAAKDAPAVHPDPRKHTLDQLVRRQDAE